MEQVREFAKGILKDDLYRISKIPNSLYLFHPGSHVKQGVDIAIEMIADALNEGIDETVDEKREVTVLLEGMSGKGTEIGRNFEELKRIIDKVENNQNLGVCLDTCHLYSAGYDIVNDLDGVLDEFDKIIGLDRLKAIHLNDSKMPFASNKDRHEQIGKGTIGMEAVKRIVTHPKLSHIPFNLETPNELEGYKTEINTLKSY